jgi:hypothetical protein
MKPPASIDDLKDGLEQYHAWSDAGGPEELCPDFMKEEFKQSNLSRMLLGLLVHIPLLLLKFMSLKIYFWPGVRWFTLARIRTDNLSFEPSQCGLNTAYTYLGIGKLKSGDIEGAINALKSSSLVWPCPHNTSFGLRMRLARELGEYPEARGAVNEYKQLAYLFNKGITNASNGRAKGARR